ncbi:hypothetical protein P0D88_38730 [Paraburkholderia sp. RL18-103-BIB-C]|uniref:hypothetical protein n=1 Tax=unclassified Paraburkholderia TaxID=2615204 RepID=UPI0038BCA224
MSAQLSEYKQGLYIQANVPNWPDQATFTGTVSIIDKRGATATDTRYMPNWVRPAQSVDEARAILLKYGIDVIEGRAQQGSDVNG